DRIVQRLLADDRGAADGVRVAADVLGRAVNDGVGAELERPLVDRRRERVVHDYERVALVGDDLLDIDEVERRVRRRLDPDQLRVVGDRRRQRREVRLVDHRVLEAPALQDLVHQPVGAAVEVVGEHDVVAGRACPSPDSSSTASRTESSVETAGNGGSITSTMSLDIIAGSDSARLSSPRSPTEPTIVVASVPETTGSWLTRCSCRRLIASLTF